jgi:hypothetical protein
MNMGMPTRKQWQELKKTYGVPAGAVSGVDVGKALDAYWNSGAKNAVQQGASAATLEVILAKYISKLDKKKVKNYTAFQKIFLDDYVGEAHTLAADAKRYNANKDVYKAELVKFFTAAQQLKVGKTTKNDLEKFKSGPLRGVSALGKNAAGVDPTKIDEWLGTVNDGIQNLKSDVSRQELDTFVEATLKTVNEVRKLAKAQGLVK